MSAIDSTRSLIIDSSDSTSLCAYINQRTIENSRQLIQAKKISQEEGRERDARRARQTYLVSKKTLGNDQITSMQGCVDCTIWCKVKTVTPRKVATTT